ncbi:LytTR family DNA-binding domain-containing protein [Bradyrhizobium sp.]|uniref:LytTR family DNA-binding domain-containing protein n=1 Tax=Bradyrhizobium sp. TaxID=376 RepID=UPI003C6A3803
MLRSLFQLAAPSSVQSRWDEWLVSGDEKQGAGTSGADPRLAVPGVYAIVTALIVISNCVGTFSIARDIAWRLGAPHNLWEPALWEITSGIVIIALLPLARTGARLIQTAMHRLLFLGIALALLLLAFSALHIAGMGLLREAAYRFAGWAYSFPWMREIPYEFPKDLFAYTAFVVIFWLGERPSAFAAPAAAEAVAPTAAGAPATPAELWLRDGRTSILINASEIVSVTSAGNYVEYQLTNGRAHLIRTTLQDQEARLAPFGIVRVHRSRLINARRIVALEWRASGDFEVRLDTGETVAGSRRFKAAVTEIAA